MNQKTLKILGWIATCTAMLMYISYFPQIINNLHGNKSGFLQPMVAAINCTLWVSYGFFQKKKFRGCSERPPEIITCIRSGELFPGCDGTDQK